MLPVKEFESRFAELLDALDALRDDVGDEDFDELCAEFEDALMLLDEIDPRAEDAREELIDALDEFDALGDDLSRYDAARDVVERLERLVGFARGVSGDGK